MRDLAVEVTMPKRYKGEEGDMFTQIYVCIKAYRNQYMY